MTRRIEHLSGAVTARMADDPRQRWHFSTEELLGQDESAKRKEDSAQEFAPLSSPIHLQKARLNELIEYSPR